MALDDIRERVRELRYSRQHLFKLLPQKSFDRISIAHAHSDAMNCKHFIPAVRNIRRLPRWAARVRLRENEMITV